MKTSKIITQLAIMIALLAVLAAGAGLLWQGVGDPYDFTSLRGESVMIYGSGDTNSEIDISECSYVIIDNISAIDSWGTMDIEDISNVSISNIKGYNVTRFLRIQNSEYVNISVPNQFHIFILFNECFLTPVLSPVQEYSIIF